MYQGLPRIVRTRPFTLREKRCRRQSELPVRRKRGERGQTILVVAVAMVSLLAMAALAIDVVTLYVARSEMQRAADAAALAGAKAFVDSGFTSDPTNTTRQALAQSMATAAINSVVQQNRVGGVAPQLAPGSPDFTNLATSLGDPQVSVTLQRTDLPTFFSRIWGRRLSTVSATAVAEAYNASNSQDGTGNYVPITPKCVKPLLVTNKDPNHGGTPFVTVDTGVAETGIVGTALTPDARLYQGGFWYLQPATCACAWDVLAGTGHTKRRELVPIL
jgi:Flp pilus assembly protein TadG